jgi:hypothetical protein
MKNLSILKSGALAETMTGGQFDQLLVVGFLDCPEGARPMPIEISIRLANLLHGTLQEAAALAGLALKSYISQSLETYAAEFRATKLPANFFADFRGEMRATPRDNEFHLRKISAAESQRILFLFFQEGLPAEVIAKRFNRSTSTIRRITDNFKARSDVRDGRRSMVRHKVHGNAWGRTL